MDSKMTNKIKRALLMDAEDNCVVALESINKGDRVCYAGGEFIACDSVDLGHKLSRFELEKGAKVIKHSAPIGSTTRKIKIGEHIHTHNLKSDYIIGFHAEDAGFRDEW